jgi:ferredoxin
MTYVITQACLEEKNGACVEVCPVDCIYDADAMFVIDPDECIDCGACEPECPVEAIYADDALPDTSTPYTGVNAAWARGGTPAVKTALQQLRTE